MRKLLLFLMLLIAATPPLLAQEKVLSMRPIEAIGGAPVIYDGSYPDYENPVKLTLGKGAVINFKFEEGYEDENNGYEWVTTNASPNVTGYISLLDENGLPNPAGFELTHDSNASSFAEGWVLTASEITEEPVLLYILYSEEELPADYDLNKSETTSPFHYRYLYFSVAEGGGVEEPDVYAPTFAITTDLGKKLGENDVFLNTASVVVTPSEYNSESGVTTYYYNGTENIMLETAEGEGDYEVTQEFPILGEDGEQLYTYNILNSAGEVVRTVNVASPDDIVLGEGEVYKSYVGGAVEKTTKYFKLNTAATELDGASATVEIKDLAAETREVNIQAVSLTTTKFESAQTGNILRLFPTELTVGNEAIELNATEESPVDLTDKTVESLNIENSMPDFTKASNLGVTVYYSINDGEPVATSDETIDLKGLIGKQKVAAWFQQTKPAEGEEPLKSNEISTWIELATPEAPAAPQFFRGPNELSGEQSVMLGMNSITLKSETAGAVLSYTTGDPDSEETVWTPYESNVVFDEPGVFTYTAKAELANFPTIFSTTSLQFTVSGAQAPRFYLNTDRNPLTETEPVLAYEGDKLVIKFFDDPADATFTYTVKEGDGEASEPVTLTVDAKTKEAEIALDKAGTFTYTGYAALNSYPEKSASSYVTVNVEERTAPEITIADDGETVSFTTGAGYRTTMWALMAPDKDPANEEAVAALTFAEVPENGTVTPGEPGYIFAYSQGEDDMKSATVGGEDYKFVLALKNAYIKLPESYLEANSKVSNTGKLALDIYVGEGDEAEQITNSFGDGFKLVVTNAAGADVTIEGNESQDGYSFGDVVITEPGVNTVKAVWESDGWYLAGETAPVEVNVYAELENIQNVSGTNSEGQYDVPFIQIASAGAIITLDVPSGVTVWYSFINVSNAEQAQNMIRKAAETEDAAYDPAASGFEKAENNQITAQGENGAFLALTQTEDGVFSPAKQYYYGTDPSVLDDITTGINGVEAAEEGAEYYDLNGYRVSGNMLKGGIYVRVLNGKATKVVVK